MIPPETTFEYESNGSWIYMWSTFDPKYQGNLYINLDREITTYVNVSFSYFTTHAIIGQHGDG